MSDTLSGIASEVYSLAFEVSPIILTGGIATSIKGGMLPIAVVLQALTIAASAVTSILTSPSSTLSNLANLQAFAHFKPLPGSTLISNTIGQYPFASVAVAAAATFINPLTIALSMDCPANGTAGFLVKTGTMIALKLVLDAHQAAGGLYTVMTPSYIYTNCCLTDLRDSSNSADRQVQVQ